MISKMRFQVAIGIGTVDAMVHSLRRRARSADRTRRHGDAASLQQRAASALRATQLLYDHGTHLAACVLVSSIHTGVGELNMATYNPTPTSPADWVRVDTAPSGARGGGVPRLGTPPLAIRVTEDGNR